MLMQAGLQKLGTKYYKNLRYIFKDLLIGVEPSLVPLTYSFWNEGTAGGGGGTWSSNIRGGAAGKSEKLPCPRVKFLKMIPSPGV